MLTISLAACLVALYQPSSAASERLFSFLERLFDDQQESALEDLREVTVMLQFNERDPSTVRPRMRLTLKDMPLGGSHTRCLCE